MSGKKRKIMISVVCAILALLLIIPTILTIISGMALI